MKNETYNANILSNMFESKCSDAVKKRLQVLVDVYEKKGWFEMSTFQ